MEEKKRRLFILVSVIMMIFILPCNVISEIFIICNKSVPASTLKKQDIKNIFLGEKLAWDDGQEIKFVTLKKSKVHKKYVKKYTKKTVSQFKRYWKRQVFTGKGTNPKSFDSEKKLIDYVANNEGSIGYISSKADSNEIKIIEISDK